MDSIMQTIFEMTLCPNLLMEELSLSFDEKKMQAKINNNNASSIKFGKHNIRCNKQYDLELR